MSNSDAQDRKSKLIYDMTRRTAIKLLAAAAALPKQCRTNAAEPESARDALWNQDWQFLLEPQAAKSAAPVSSSGSSHVELPEFPAGEWEAVALPHFAVWEPYDVSQCFQGICWYRKTLVPQPGWRDRLVSLEFQGAMQEATVWVNREHQLTHSGGYLPFTVDVTRLLAAGKPMEITVRLDNRDNSSIPPGKPLKEMDFEYFPGLYRNVVLHLTDRMHITDAVDADRVAGGGVFVRYSNVSESSAEVNVSTHIRNEYGQGRDARVTTVIRDRQEKVVSRMESDVATIARGGDRTFSQTLKVHQPKLWSPDDPYLYTLHIQVSSSEGTVDEYRQRIGIRTVRSDPRQGFFLNGRHMVPNGANRHQAYPHIGNALSDEAQYRDALKLKEAGFELIRLSHYPQSPAFLDACDELGLMTIECIPGWQFFENSETFKTNVTQNLRDMIRRDRNHPSAILWETSLNETDGHDLFFRKLVEVAHEEYPGDQMLTCGDTEGHKYDVIRYDVPYSGWDGDAHTRPSRAHGAMSLHREYGDNQFGGYSRYTRGDGELLMLVQAWNYQTALNQQMKLPYTWGQCIWEAVDNNRGLAPMIATCGALDPFRLPKFMYYFFQSQRNPLVVHPEYSSGPMAYIANYWCPKSPADVVVFSNADEVELFVNGKSIARRKPDDGADTPFGDDTGFDLNYWLKSGAAPADERKKTVATPIYDGGNCRSLSHPPFTFAKVAYEPGELKAVAYIKGVEAATAIRRTPGEPHHLTLSVDLAGKDLVAGGGDVIFVHAEIRDALGTIVPQSAVTVRFDVAGEGVVIGESTRNAEAGVASTLLRSKRDPGIIGIQASADGLRPAEIKFRSISYKRARG